MRSFPVRLLRLLLGLFLYALGVALTIEARIGYAPWDVFHVGLAATLGLSIGTAAIATGLAVLGAAWALGERPGLGTVLNMLLIGLFLDGLLALGLIPEPASFAGGAAMMVAGLFVIALASFFYIGSGLGAGPRDSLMVALTRRTGLPVGLVRGGIEVSVVLVGWLLGGMVGAGTILAALAVGLCVQLTFRVLRFDPTAVRHEALMETLASLAPRRGGRDAPSFRARDPAERLHKR